MRLTLLRYWDRVRSSYWFVPTVMVLGVFAVFVVTLKIDLSHRRSIEKTLEWVRIGDADGVRQVLATVAGSIITVAGVSFSIMIVVLSLASQQLGPRIISSFMRDRGNQFCLGAFIATFLGNLLALQATAGAFIPLLSIAFAWALGLMSLGVLIYFVHHVAEMIQADNAIAMIGEDLDGTIHRLFPHDSDSRGADDEAARAAMPSDLDTHAAFVLARTSGYIQTIEYEKVLETATRLDLFVRVDHRPGHFVLPHTPIFYVHPMERCTEELAQKLREHVTCGKVRTHTQDAEFGINQLTEIAVRALSPGVNDPNTAMRCVDRLAEALAQSMRRSTPARGLRDAAGRVRVVRDVTDFGSMLDAAFDQVRQNAASVVAVSARLLEAIHAIAPAASREADRAALRRHADMVLRGCERTIEEPADMQAIESRHALACDALQRRDAPAPQQHSRK